MPRELRIAVGRPDELHSSVWKIWTQGDELYAAQVNTLTVTKLSVHSSGVCRIANTDKFAGRFNWGPTHTHSDPDLLARWKIDGVGSSEPWVTCFTLNVPSVYVRERFKADIRPSRVSTVHWLTPPPLLFMTSIWLIRARSPDLDVKSILVGAGNRVVGSLPLRSGGQVWVVAFPQRMNERDFVQWHKKLSTFRISWPDDADPDPLFTSLLAPHLSHPWPHLVEVACGWDQMSFGDSGETRPRGPRRS